MADVQDGLLYIESHEWIREQDGALEIGITSHAQEQLGDIVYLEFPDVGRTLAKGEAFGVIESVKTLSDLYAPTAGEVIAVNTALDDTPETVNEDPYGGGWLVRLKPTNWDAEKGDLMDATAYKAFLDAEG